MKLSSMPPLDKVTIWLRAGVMSAGASWAWQTLAAPRHSQPTTAQAIAVLMMNFRFASPLTFILFMKFLMFLLDIVAFIILIQIQFFFVARNPSDAFFEFGHGFHRAFIGLYTFHAETLQKNLRQFTAMIPKSLKTQKRTAIFTKDAFTIIILTLRRQFTTPNFLGVSGSSFMKTAVLDQKSGSKIREVLDCQSSGALKGTYSGRER